MGESLDSNGEKIGRRALECLTALLSCVLALLPATAHSQLVVSGGAEYFRWHEDSTPQVRESGPMGTIGLAYTQQEEAGILFAYRGKLWSGSADYEGATLVGGTPVQSTTDYEGISNELQARWRMPGKPGEGSLDGVFGLGLDLWRRELSHVQKEDYAIGFLRLGVESGGDYEGKWAVALGFKYPVWTYENAHFDRIGFDSNPILHPGKELSPYGSLGYYLSENLRLTAYYDGFRFGKSKEVQANEIATGLGPTMLFQPGTQMSVYGLKFEYRIR